MNHYIDGTICLQSYIRIDYTVSFYDFLKKCLSRAYSSSAIMYACIKRIFSSPLQYNALLVPFTTSSVMSTCLTVCASIEFPESSQASSSYRSPAVNVSSKIACYLARTYGVSYIASSNTVSYPPVSTKSKNQSGTYHYSAQASCASAFLFRFTTNLVYGHAGKLHLHTRVAK